MYRLIYKSRSTGKISWELIDSILRHSQESNARDGISGVLLATNNCFLQVLEGPHEALNQTFMRIVRDGRHEKVQLISFNCMEKRIFGDWAMHGIGIFDFNLELAERLKQKFGEENGDLRLPVEEWQVLSMISDIRLART